MKELKRPLFEIPTISKELVHITDFTTCRISPMELCRTISFVMKSRS